jgi:hypothetical protein
MKGNRDMEWVDDDSRGRPKMILREDFDHIPGHVKMRMSTIKALDGTIRQIYHIPVEWRNHYVQFRNVELPNALPLRFDRDGWSYVEIPRKRGSRFHIKVYFKDDYESIIDHMARAEDWCDECGLPLENQADDFLIWAESGDTEAELYICPYCQNENRREV